jgi:hypothetical protein
MLSSLIKIRFDILESNSKFPQKRKEKRVTIKEIESENSVVEDLKQKPEILALIP